MRYWRRNKRQMLATAEYVNAEDYARHVAQLVNHRISRIPHDRPFHTAWPPSPIDSLAQLNGMMLIALVNSYFPGTINPYVLLNDRSTLMVALELLRALFHLDLNLTPQDFNEEICHLQCYAIYVGQAIRNGDDIEREIQRRERHRLLKLQLDRAQREQLATFAKPADVDDLMKSIDRRAVVMKEIKQLELKLERVSECQVSKRIADHVTK